MRVKDCPQCHVPPAECRPHVKHPNPMRLRLDTRRDAEQAAADGQSRDVTSFITEATEARLGYLRCDRGRCLEHGTPVPVTFGDLAGRPLGEWIADAVRDMLRQHPRHEPVTIGRTADAANGNAPVPAARPGAAVFMEPGSVPHVTPVPEVQDHGTKRGRVSA